MEMTAECASCGRARARLVGPRVLLVALGW